MIALLQRVSEASVLINEDSKASWLSGKIGAGILALVAVEKGDTEAQADRLLERILAYRIFEDENGRMNLSLRQTGGQLLLVSQFTLAANTNSGNRPSFTPAAAPAEGERLFDYLLESARAELGEVPSGCIGAHMEVSLVNDGPVTFNLRVAPPD
ncbi:MAG: D-tyrosyl-tRNA(Tyr) deacylase [Alcanivorax sp.]|nr:D-tyrosyl-tRNA(Tyr) deacylase [Alcanivorax sp.]